MFTLPLRSIAAASTLLCAGAPAVAYDWTSQSEAGIVMSRGNANTDNANVKFSLNTHGDRWNNTAALGGLYGRSNKVNAAQRWDARWQTDFKLNLKSFVFGAIRHEQDRFGGFAYQTTLSTGGGYQFADTDTTKFKVSLGAGYRRLQPQQLVRDETGVVTARLESPVTDGVVANAAVEFQQQITQTARIVNSTVVESGSENTFGQNNLSLQVAMTEKMAVSLGYGLRHNSEPPAGLRKTDQLTTANLVYRFN